jgi:hypothetical protein
MRLKENTTRTIQEILHSRTWLRGLVINDTISVGRREVTKKKKKKEKNPNHRAPNFVAEKTPLLKA